MRKFFAVLAFAVFASLAFAQYGPPPSYDRHDQPPPPPSYGRRNQPSPQRHGDGWMDFATYFSVNFAAPIQWQKISDWDYSTDTRTTSLGLGLDLTTFLTRRVGFHVSADFYFPQKMSGTQSIAGVSSAMDYNLQEEWDSDWGLSIFAGPSFALIRGPRVVFALAPGLHYYVFFAEQGRNSVFQYAFGIGANAELMLNVTRTVFLRAAVDATWDFWGSEEYHTGFWTEYSNVDRAINITPQVGIGFKL